MGVIDTIRRVALGIGALILLGGFALLFLPGVAESVNIGLLLAQFAAVIALLLGAFLVRERYNSTPRTAEIPEVEWPLSTPTPGDELDDWVYRLTVLRESTIEYRDQIRNRVAEVAVAVIRQEEDCSREEAIGQLRNGSWTDVADAANFFTQGGSGGGDVSLLTQLQRRFFGGQTVFERQLNAAVDALEERAGFVEQNPATDDEVDGLSMDASKILADDDGERVAPHARYRELLPTRQWTGIAAFSFAAVALGVFSARPAVLLSSVAALGVAGYAQASSAPPAANLSVERTLSNDTPEPGEEVDVRVEVENTGDAFLTDLRLVDRVPPTMRVVDGSPRLGTALRGGQTATFEYTMVADRGEHTWTLEVVARDPAGSVEREAFLEDEECELSCRPRLKTAVETPVRMQTSMYTGSVSTEMGGGGLEFHAVRDYLPGDPMRRINWKQFARTGEFSTIDFREERAAKISLLFDAREAAYVSPGPGERHAVDRSVEASYDVFSSLVDAGHLVGLAAFDTVPLWLGPSTGDQHVERARRLFVNHPAISPLPPDLLDKSGGYVDPMTHIRRQLPKNTQIFLFSPLTEDFVYEVARRLDGAGHLITVVSPDPTATRTVGQRLARLARKSRVIRLREHGIRVIDWSPDRSLRLEIERATQRW